MIGAESEHQVTAVKTREFTLERYSTFVTETCCDYLIQVSLSQRHGGDYKSKVGTMCGLVLKWKKKFPGETTNEF